MIWAIITMISDQWYIVILLNFLEKIHIMISLGVLELERIQI
jgi:hypothetical protein